VFKTSFIINFFIYYYYLSVYSLTNCILVNCKNTHSICTCLYLSSITFAINTSISPFHIHSIKYSFSSTSFTYFFISVIHSSLYYLLYQKNPSFQILFSNLYSSIPIYSIYPLILTNPLTRHYYCQMKIYYIITPFHSNHTPQQILTCY
jgi:hypothetical protein